MINFTAIIDVGNVRSENQDRSSADPELGLFVVAGCRAHARVGMASGERN
jgi:hypothetical protein